MRLTKAHKTFEQIVSDPEQPEFEFRFICRTIALAEESVVWDMVSRLETEFMPLYEVNGQLAKDSAGIAVQKGFPIIHPDLVAQAPLLATPKSLEIAAFILYAWAGPEETRPEVINLIRMSYNDALLVGMSEIAAKIRRRLEIEDGSNKGGDAGSPLSDPPSGKDGDTSTLNSTSSSSASAPSEPLEPSPESSE